MSLGTASLASLCQEHRVPSSAGVRVKAAACGSGDAQDLHPQHGWKCSGMSQLAAVMGIIGTRAVSCAW